MRADAEMVLNDAGRAVLAELCGVSPRVLARALPAFTVDDPKISSGQEAAQPPSTSEQQQVTIKINKHI